MTDEDHDKDFNNDESRIPVENTIINNANNMSLQFEFDLNNNGVYST